MLLQVYEKDLLCPDTCGQLQCLPERIERGPGDMVRWESETMPQAILEYPHFQLDGRFHMGRFQAFLNHYRMKPEDFEAAVAQDLLESKLRQFLLAFMEVTDQEVLDHYTYINEKIKISFVQFTPDTFKKHVEPEQSSMEAFFEEHKEDYRVPEKIKIASLVIDPATFGNQVKLTDQEINDYYEYNIETYSQPKEVKARHILFKLNDDASEAEEKEVREKAVSVPGMDSNFIIIS